MDGLDIVRAVIVVIVAVVVVLRELVGLVVVSESRAAVVVFEDSGCLVEAGAAGVPVLPGRLDLELLLACCVQPRSGYRPSRLGVVVVVNDRRQFYHNLAVAVVNTITYSMVVAMGAELRGVLPRMRAGPNLLRRAPPPLPATPLCRLQQRVPGFAQGEVTPA